MEIRSIVGRRKVWFWPVVGSVVLAACGGGEGEELARAESRATPTVMADEAGLAVAAAQAEPEAAAEEAGPALPPGARPVRALGSAAAAVLGQAFADSWAPSDLGSAEVASSGEPEAAPLVTNVEGRAYALAAPQTVVIDGGAMDAATAAEMGASVAAEEQFLALPSSIDFVNEIAANSLSPIALAATDAPACTKRIVIGPTFGLIKNGYVVLKERVRAADGKVTYIDRGTFIAKQGCLAFDGAANRETIVQISNDAKFGDTDTFWLVKQNNQGAHTVTKAVVLAVDDDENLRVGARVVVQPTSGLVSYGVDNEKPVRSDLDISGNIKFSTIVPKGFDGRVVIQNTNKSSFVWQVNDLGTSKQKWFLLDGDGPGARPKFTPKEVLARKLAMDLNAAQQTMELVFYRAQWGGYSLRGVKEALVTEIRLNRNRAGFDGRDFAEAYQFARKVSKPGWSEVASDGQRVVFNDLVKVYPKGRAGGLRVIRNLAEVHIRTAGQVNEVLLAARYADISSALSDFVNFADYGIADLDAGLPPSLSANAVLEGNIQAMQRAAGKLATHIERAEVVLTRLSQFDGNGYDLDALSGRTNYIGYVTSTVQNRLGSVLDATDAVLGRHVAGIKASAAYAAKAEARLRAFAMINMFANVLAATGNLSTAAANIVKVGQSASLLAVMVAGGNTATTIGNYISAGVTYKGVLFALSETDSSTSVENRTDEILGTAGKTTTFAVSSVASTAAGSIGDRIRRTLGKLSEAEVFIAKQVAGLQYVVKLGSARPALEDGQPGVPGWNGTLGVWAPEADGIATYIGFREFSGGPDDLEVSRIYYKRWLVLAP